MDNEEKLYKQRRNLIISSIVLSIYEIIGLELTVLNVLGNEFLINNQQSLTYLLIGFWIYSLLRYYQYAVELGRHIKVSNRFSNILSSHSSYPVTKKIKTIGRRKMSNKSINDSRVVANIKGGNYYDLEKTSLFKWKLNQEITSGSSKIEDVSAEYSIRDLFIPFLKSLSELTLRTPLVTEYILPYVLALATLVTLVIS